MVSTVSTGHCRRQLTAKRRKESVDCARRLEQARERFIRSQDHLRQLLKEKDDRNKVLIDTLARHKETLLREHREQEESRRLAVDYAVKVSWAERRTGWKSWNNGKEVPR